MSGTVCCCKLMVLCSCSEINLESFLEGVKVVSIGDFRVFRDKEVDHDFGSSVEDEVEEHGVFADSGETEKLVEAERDLGAAIDDEF